MVEYRHFLWKVSQSLHQKYSAEKPYFLYDGHRAHCNVDIVKAVSEYFIPL